VEDLESAEKRLENLRYNDYNQSIEDKLDELVYGMLAIIKHLKGIEEE
jgi:ribosomal protein L30/L7E